MQHYWSLSLEEQFYVMWPLLMLLAAWIGVKWFRGARRRAVITTLAVVSVVSFVFCVVFTMTNPAPAYFVTFGRMWQFGVGAMVALVPMLRIRNAIGSFVLGWAGIAVLLYAVFQFDGQTPFPGYAALVPTLGAAAVIMASNHERWWYPTRVLAIRPAQFVGDISYSLYLWHWPLIIIAPSVPFWGLTIYHRLALLGAVLRAGLAHQAVRRGPGARLEGAHLATRPGDAVVVARRDAARRRRRRRRVGRERARLQRRRPGDPGAARESAAVLRRRGRAGSSPARAPTSATRSCPRPDSRASTGRPTTQCFVQLNDARPVSCTFGSDDPDAPRVALIGDSHAYQLLVDLPGDGRRERLAARHLLQGRLPLEHDAARDARRVRRRVHRVARQRDRPSSPNADLDAVFTAAIATTPYSSAGYSSSHDAAVAGYREAWSEMTDRGIPVITVVDNPVWETDPNKCLRTRAMIGVRRPAFDLLVADDPLREAASGHDRVTLLDFTDVFCGEEVCRPVVGGANIYRDQDHLTVTFVDTLAPWYTEAIEAALAARGQ